METTENSEEFRQKSLQGDMHLADNREQVEMDMDKSDEDTSFNNNIVTTYKTNSDSTGAIGKIDSRHKIYDVTEIKGLSNIIQVTNISPAATLEQMTTLFGFLGDIVNIKLYHSNQNSQTNFKVCLVEFLKQSSVLMAQHLTNTVFIDRALSVLSYSKHEMPDGETAINSIERSNTATSFNCGFVSQAMTSVGGAQVITTIDPRLTALGLPQYPQLPVNTDPTRIEEIRRTVYIGNLDSTLSPEQVLKFFNDIGEVKYIRLAGDDTQPTRFAFVEFTHQSSVANALQHNGFVLGSRPLKINHSNNAIVKPQPKIEGDDSSKRLPRDNHDHSSSRELRELSRDRHSRYDRDRSDRPRDRDRDRDWHRERRVSPRNSKSRRSKSRDRETSSRKQSRSRDRSSRRSKSRDRSLRRRSRSRDSRRRRSRSRSEERSRSRHHRSSRR